MSKTIYVGKVVDHEAIFAKYSDRLVYNHTNINISEITDFIQTVPFLSDTRAIIVFGSELLVASERKKLLTVDVPDWSHLILFYEGKESSIVKEIKDGSVKVILVEPVAPVPKKALFSLIDVMFDGELFNTLNLYNRMIESGELNTPSILALVGRKLKVLCLASDNNYKCVTSYYKLPPYLWNKTKITADRFGQNRLKKLLSEWVYTNEAIRRNWSIDSLYVEKLIVSIAGGV